MTAGAVAGDGRADWDEATLPTTAGDGAGDAKSDRDEATLPTSGVAGDGRQSRDEASLPSSDGNVSAPTTAPVATGAPPIGAHSGAAPPRTRPLGFVWPDRHHARAPGDDIHDDYLRLAASTQWLRVSVSKG